MPPSELAMLTLISSNLAEDFVKISEFIQKILDVKTEVCSTADTVRQMKMDVVDIRCKSKKCYYWYGKNCRGYK